MSRSNRLGSLMPTDSIRLARNTWVCQKRLWNDSNGAEGSFHVEIGSGFAGENRL